MALAGGEAQLGNWMSTHDDNNYNQATVQIVQLQGATAYYFEFSTECKEYGKEWAG
jgi:hypothetical protein